MCAGRGSAHAKERVDAAARRASPSCCAMAARTRRMRCIAASKTEAVTRRGEQGLRGHAADVRQWPPSHGARPARRAPEPGGRDRGDRARGARADDDEVVARAAGAGLRQLTGNADWRHAASTSTSTGLIRGHPRPHGPADSRCSSPRATRVTSTVTAMVAARPKPSSTQPVSPMLALPASAWPRFGGHRFGGHVGVKAADVTGKIGEREADIRHGETRARRSRPSSRAADPRSRSAAKSSLKVMTSMARSPTWKNEATTSSLS